MVGEVLKFPTGDYRPAPPPVMRDIPTFETFDVPASKRLLKLVQGDLQKAEELFELVDSRRADARVAGVESIAIEICALVEGGSLDAVVDTLLESLEKNVDAHVTTSGMDRVRRVERLLAESARGLVHMKPAGAAQAAPMLIPLGTARTSDDGRGHIWVPVAFFGLVIIGLVAVAILSPAQKR